MSNKESILNLRIKIKFIDPDLYAEPIYCQVEFDTNEAEYIINHITGLGEFTDYLKNDSP